MTAPTPSPKAPTSVVKFEPSGTRRAAAEFFRSITLGSPEWVRRMEGEVLAGNKQIIRLLAGYLPALPPGLRAAVLAARSRL
jgi:hypothetical protein